MSDPPRYLSGATTHETEPPSSFDRSILLDVALVVVHSPDQGSLGRVIPLNDEAVLVGREVEGPGGVGIEDARLSRLHFRITFDGRTDTHRVTDARSRNGTFVGGSRLETAVLRRGDVVRAGDSVFVYGAPSPLSKVKERIARVARSDLAVLLLGETGTGKERFARAVHDLSGRGGAFVAVNCAALPRELLGSELFGHAKGAFSGAAQARQGLFLSAAGGTILLDEIGDFPLELQPILLRALQEKVVRPIGADQEVPVDVRIIAATHQKLENSVRTERFRADLYARLAQSVVEVPPVRERRVEILALAVELARAASREVEFSADAAEALVRHSWPFNVREIESLVRGFVATETEPKLRLRYLKEYHAGLVLGFRDDGAGVDATNRPVPPAGGASPDRAALESILVRHGGNVSAVAKELGKERAQVYRWLRGFGLDPERYRES
jgi:transcriptional regulator with GAF, ATPase, and Fis domain